jgi:hypothetical protein
MSAPRPPKPVLCTEVVRGLAPHPPCALRGAVVDVVPVVFLTWCRCATVVARFWRKYGSRRRGKRRRKRSRGPRKRSRPDTGYCCGVCASSFEHAGSLRVHWGRVHRLTVVVPIYVPGPLHTMVQYVARNGSRVGLFRSAADAAFVGGDVTERTCLGVRGELLGMHLVEPPELPLYTGVYPFGNKFVAKIKVKSRIVVVGTYGTSTDAAAAWDVEAVKQGVDLNFPPLPDVLDFTV